MILLLTRYSTTFISLTSIVAIFSSLTLLLAFAESKKENTYKPSPLLTISFIINGTNLLGLICVSTNDLTSLIPKKF